MGNDEAQHGRNIVSQVSAAVLMYYWHLYWHALLFDDTAGMHSP